MTIDINCDMGEGIGPDDSLMPYIHSANIACGFHAGNGDIIRHTIELALRYGVKIGAHPSFRDKENFGRKEMHVSSDKIYALVIEQLIKMDLLAREKGARLHHIKPHGALYNMSARDPQVARVIAQAASDFQPDIVLYGLSGSHSISEAKNVGLKTASEIFADRTYQDDGSLTPRSQPHALIENEEEMMQQLMQMIQQGKVNTVAGHDIPILAETVCIHSDGRQALPFARAISHALKAIQPQEQ